MPRVPDMGGVSLLLHPSTETEIQNLLTSPVHGVLITGAQGSGKSTIARMIASGLLNLGEMSLDAYRNHPYVRVIAAEAGKSISIETIRELQHFLSLKIPGADTMQGISRLVVIEDAHRMTTEAQNALLKTLEEPPAGTVLLLTSTTLDAVLPTIQSRVRQLAIRPPEADQVLDYFASHGFGRESIKRVLLISGGLPGMTHSLLVEDDTHPLVVATTHARGILQSKTYERLILVDSLAKQKELCLDVCYVLGRMSRMALRQSSNSAAAERWKRVLRASYDAELQLHRSVQAKLVLTNLMLSI